MNLSEVSLLLLDVDGVLTDGGLTYGAEGEVLKRFHVQDGYAIRQWHRCGGSTAIVSGRDHPSVAQRAGDLGVSLVYQGQQDKLEAYMAILRQMGVRDHQTCCMGDDIPDVVCMRRCGFPVAVANARPEVKRAAAYVTRCMGGTGAVAEVIELLLRHRNQP